MTNDLPKEEWGFFAKKKEWLNDEFRERLWIPEDEVKIALAHEIDREYARAAFLNQ